MRTKLMTIKTTHVLGSLALISFMISGSASHVVAGYIPIYGAPAYNPVTKTGFRAPSSLDSKFNPQLAPIHLVPVNDAGTAIAIHHSKYENGFLVQNAAVRWNASANTELVPLNFDDNGHSESGAYAINNNNLVVGYSYVYEGNSNLGSRALRWDAVTATATELDHLESTDVTTYGRAFSINDEGVAVGYARKWTTPGDPPYPGTDVLRAVRWDPTTTAAIELAFIGPPNSIRSSVATAVNKHAIIVGNIGDRVVRWQSYGATVTELDGLGTNSSGDRQNAPTDINDNAVTVGWAKKFIAGVDKGIRAVRWDPSGTAITELGNLGTDSTGVTESAAIDVNNMGISVGYALKYYPTTSTRVAVLWDTNGDVPVELKSIAVDPNALTTSQATAINDHGFAVGYAGVVQRGSPVYAVVWKPDGSIVNLNSLIDPSSGWFLREAIGISNTGWITGHGTYDPDGPGGYAPYARSFLLRLVPESSSLILAILGSAAPIWTRRRPC